MWKCAKVVRQKSAKSAKLADLDERRKAFCVKGMRGKSRKSAKQVKRAVKKVGL